MRPTRPNCYAIPSDRLITYLWVKQQPEWLTLWQRIVRAWGRR